MTFLADDVQSNFNDLFFWVSLKVDIHNLYVAISIFWSLYPFSPTLLQVLMSSLPRSPPPTRLGLSLLLVDRCALALLCQFKLLLGRMGRVWDLALWGIMAVLVPLQGFHHGPTVVRKGESCKPWKA